MKIFRVYVKIKGFSLTVVFWGIGGRDPTHVLGHQGPLLHHPSPTRALRGGRWEGCRSRGEKGWRILGGCLKISITFLFAFGHGFIFPSDFRSEFTLRPKAPPGLFPSLKLQSAGGHFIPPNIQNLYMIKAELGQN